MKVQILPLTLALSGLSTLALASPFPFAKAEAVADASASADPRIHFWCYRRGEPCYKVKRAAEAVAEAFEKRDALPFPDAHPAAAADPEARIRFWCYRRGEPCYKAKRDAVAIADAVDEAHANMHADDDDVIFSDHALNATELATAKAAHQAADAKSDAASADDAKPIEARAAEGDAEAKVGDPPAGGLGEFLQKYGQQLDAGAPLGRGPQWCYRKGEPCSKVKRAAGAIAAALAEPAAAPEAGNELEARARFWCYRRGEPCYKAKRSLEVLEARFKELVKDR